MNHPHRTSPPCTPRHATLVMTCHDYVIYVQCWNVLNAFIFDCSILEVSRYFAVKLSCTEIRLVWPKIGLVFLTEFGTVVITFEPQSPWWRLGPESATTSLRNLLWSNESNWYGSKFGTPKIRPFGTGTKLGLKLWPVCNWLQLYASLLLHSCRFHSASTEI
jgi:hypothetical protein